MPTTSADSSKSEEAEKLRFISHADTAGTTVDGEMRMVRGRLCRCGRADMTRQLGRAGQIGGCPGRQDQVDGTGTAADFDVDLAAVQEGPCAPRSPPPATEPHQRRQRWRRSGVRHGTATGALSSSGPGFVDRVTFNARIIETGTQSYWLATSATSSRKRPAAASDPG